MQHGYRRKQRSPRARYYLTLGRGETVRCLALRPWALYLLAISLPLGLVLGAFAAARIAYPGDSASVMAARRAELRSDYDARLTALRQKMERASNQSAHDRLILEAKARALAARLVRLDQRAHTIAALAARSRSSVAQPPSSVPIPRRPPLLDSPARADASLPDSAQAFAPLSNALVPPATPRSAVGAGKPRPDGLEIGADEDKTSALVSDPIDDPGLPIGARLSAMNADLSGVEVKQLKAVVRIERSVAKEAARIRLAMAQTGLGLDRIKGDGASLADYGDVGGPFVPIKFEPGASPLDNQLHRLETQIVEDEKIDRALPYLPFRQPLAGTLYTTSPFGVRLDPFLGRLAMHTGNDFRGAIGTKVMATAAGRVAAAGYDGGYGNRVVVDHGHGLSTLYAHLSAIDVVKGQKITAGQTVGLLGSTGRSTGPHLHYEVRIDGRPVDPIPFVKAGEPLFASR
ncbi:MAG TPA: M23 family metallopeptidase [Beijerinckiaceae bacterium]|nr:M23 family metallopeptidase [Beijerinckiaceae bacterium]